MKRSIAFFKPMTAAIAVAVCSQMLMAGNVCTWQGGSGKFSDATNWDVAPISGNGDTLVFDTADGAAITVENDIADDFDVAMLSFANKDRTLGDCGKITFTGRRLYVSGSAAKDVVVWQHGDSTVEVNRGPEIEVDMPIRFKGGRLWISKSHTFKQKITIDDNGYFCLHWPKRYETAYPTITFSDEIYGPEATLDNSAGNGGHGSTIYYDGKVTLAHFYVNHCTWGNCEARLNYPENDIPDFWVRYARMTFNSSPCVNTSTVIRLSNDSGNTRVWVFSDVVCDRIAPAGTQYHQTVNGSSTTDCSLTMKASADTSSAVNFGNKLTLIYDPVGAYTYTLVDSTSGMSGKLEIKGGTFKLKGATVFTAVPEVIVHKGATLDLSESTAPTPFPAAARLSVRVGGKVVLPVNGGVTFGTGFYKGVPLAAGDYTGCAWVEGGTVTIANGPAAGHCYWSHAASGNWNDSVNWIPAVPTATDTAVIMAEDSSDYVVTMTGAETKPAKIEVRCNVEDTAKLQITGEANFTTNTTFAIGEGGELEVAPTGKFIYDAIDLMTLDTTIMIDRGRFVVNGGYATLTNFLGYAVVKGAGAEMLVENNGTLILSDRNDDKTRTGMLAVRDGSKLKMTSGVIAIPSQFYYSFIGLKGGSCEFSGGSVRFSRISNPNCISFTDNTTFSGTVDNWYSGDIRMSIAPYASNRSMVFAFKNSATMSGGMMFVLMIGGGVGGNTTYLMDSTGISQATVVYIGAGKGTGTLRQTAGLFKAGAKGLAVGLSGALWHAGGKDSLDESVTGTIEISGGALFVDGGGATHDTWGHAFVNSLAPGLLIGYGCSTNAHEGRPYVGRMTISDTGSVTNQLGHLFVGVAPYGDGSLVMNGGTLRSGEGIPDKYREVIGCAVGIGGGKGVFTVNGGDCKIWNNVWIGGATTNSVRIMPDDAVVDSVTYGYPFNAHDGDGTMTVTGGKVELVRDLVVGAEGTGRVEVVGSAATHFTVGRDLVLSNAAAVVSGGAATATLALKPDASGITPIEVVGRLVVTEQARLEVDLSNCNLTATGKLQLLAFGEEVGAFAPENVEFTGSPRTPYLRVTGDGLWVGYRNGTMVIFK